MIGSEPKRTNLGDYTLTDNKEVKLDLENISPEIRIQLNDFSPAMLLNLLDHAPSRACQVRESQFTGVIAIIDISGFTKLSARLAEKGNDGIEELMGHLNAYFGQLIEIIHAWGGDIIAFAGDALITLWSVEVPESTLTQSLLFSEEGPSNDDNIVPNPSNHSQSSTENQIHASEAQHARATTSLLLLKQKASEHLSASILTHKPPHTDTPSAFIRPSLSFDQISKSSFDDKASGKALATSLSAHQLSMAQPPYHENSTSSSENHYCTSNTHQPLNINNNNSNVTLGPQQDTLTPALSSDGPSLASASTFAESLDTGYSHNNPNSSQNKARVSPPNLPTATANQNLRQLSYFEKMQYCALRAIECSLDIQSRLPYYDSNPQEKNKDKKDVLTIHISIGMGRCTGMHVGGYNDTWFWLIGGAPFSQIHNIDRYSGSHDVVVSPEVYTIIHNLCCAKQVGDPKGQRAYKVQYVPQNYLSKLRPCNLSGFNKTLSDKILHYTNLSVIATISEKMHGDGEIRTATVLFIGCHEARAHDALKIISTYTQITQQKCKLYNAVINKVLIDEKGCTIIVVLGLVPEGAHLDDPTRGSLLALSLKNDLSDVGLSCSIGVATGRIFCGIYGKMDIRREYCILGSTVNLAARLMGFSTKDILVDQNTHKLSLDNVKFETWPAITLKGLSEPIQVYRPMMKSLTPLTTTAISNDLSSSSNMKNSSTKTEFIGRTMEIEYIGNTISQLKRAGSTSIRAICISGVAGIGKTAVADESLMICESNDVLTYHYISDVSTQRPFSAFTNLLSNIFKFKTFTGDESIDAHNRHNGQRVLDYLQQYQDLIAFAPLLNDVLGRRSNMSSMATSSLFIDGDDICLLGLDEAERHKETVHLISAIIVRHYIAKKAVVFVLDDVEWFDIASWRVLQILIADLSNFLCIVFSRTGTSYPDPACMHIYRLICNSPVAVCLDLSPLGKSDAIQLAADLLKVEPSVIPNSVQTVILEKSQGRPKFIKELVAQLGKLGMVIDESSRGKTITENPAFRNVDIGGIEGGIIQRVDALPKSHQLLVKVASCVGKFFNKSVVEYVLGHITSNVSDVDAMDTPAWESTCTQLEIIKYRDSSSLDAIALSDLSLSLSRGTLPHNASSTSSLPIIQQQQQQHLFEDDDNTSAKGLEYNIEDLKSQQQSNDATFTCSSGTNDALAVLKRSQMLPLRPSLVRQSYHAASHAKTASFHEISVKELGDYRTRVSSEGTLTKKKAPKNRNSEGDSTFKKKMSDSLKTPATNTTAAGRNSLPENTFDHASLSISSDFNYSAQNPLASGDDDDDDDDDDDNDNLADKDEKLNQPEVLQDSNSPLTSIQATKKSEKTTKRFSSERKGLNQTSTVSNSSLGSPNSTSSLIMDQSKTEPVILLNQAQHLGAQNSHEPLGPKLSALQDPRDNLESFSDCLFDKKTAYKFTNESVMQVIYRLLLNKHRTEIHRHIKNWMSLYHQGNQDLSYFKAKQAMQSKEYMEVTEILHYSTLYTITHFDIAACIQYFYLFIKALDKWKENYRSLDPGLYALRRAIAIFYLSKFYYLNGESHLAKKYSNLLLRERVNVSVAPQPHHKDSVTSLKSLRDNSNPPSVAPYPGNMSKQTFLQRTKSLMSRKNSPSVAVLMPTGPIIHPSSSPAYDLSFTDTPLASYSSLPPGRPSTSGLDMNSGEATSPSSHQSISHAKSLTTTLFKSSSFRGQAGDNPDSKYKKPSIIYPHSHQQLPSTPYQQQQQQQHQQQHQSGKDRRQINMMATQPSQNGNSTTNNYSVPAPSTPTGNGVYFASSHNSLCDKPSALQAKKTSKGSLAQTLMTRESKEDCEDRALSPSSSFEKLSGLQNSTSTTTLQPVYMDEYTEASGSTTIPNFPDTFEAAQSVPLRTHSIFKTYDNAGASMGALISTGGSGFPRPLSDTKILESYEKRPMLFAQKVESLIEKCETQDMVSERGYLNFLLYKNPQSQGFIRTAEYLDFESNKDPYLDTDTTLWIVSSPSLEWYMSYIYATCHFYQAVSLEQDLQSMTALEHLLYACAYLEEHPVTSLTLCILSMLANYFNYGEFKIKNTETMHERIIQCANKMGEVDKDRYRLLSFAYMFISQCQIREGMLLIAKMNLDAAYGHLIDQNLEGCLKFVNYLVNFIKFWRGMDIRLEKKGHPYHHPNASNFLHHLAQEQATKDETSDVFQNLIKNKIYLSKGKIYKSLLLKDANDSLCKYAIEKFISQSQAAFTYFLLKDNDKVMKTVDSVLEQVKRMCGSILSPMVDGVYYLSETLVGYLLAEPRKISPSVIYKRIEILNVLFEQLSSQAPLVRPFFKYHRAKIELSERRYDKALALLNAAKVDATNMYLAFFVALIDLQIYTVLDAAETDKEKATYSAQKKKLSPRLCYGLLNHYDLKYYICQLKKVYHSDLSVKVGLRPLDQFIRDLSRIKVPDKLTELEYAKKLLILVKEEDLFEVLRAVARSFASAIVIYYRCQGLSQVPNSLDLLFESIRTLMADKQITQHQYSHLLSLLNVAQVGNSTQGFLRYWEDGRSDQPALLKPACIACRQLQISFERHEYLLDRTVLDKLKRFDY